MGTSEASASNGRGVSRVLLFHHDMLWPRIGGGRLRVGELLDRTLRESQVDLIAIARPDYVARDSSAVPRLPGLTVHAFPDESPPAAAPARFAAEAMALIRRLSAERGGFDVVHVEGNCLMPMVPPELYPRTVLVEHNIESELLAQRLALGEPLSAEVSAQREREEVPWRQVAAVVTLCPEDARRVCARAPGAELHVIQNGWDHIPPPASVRSERGKLEHPVLLFNADFDYLPNQDAFAWLTEDIFPIVRKSVPGASLAIKGINMSPDFIKIGERTPGLVVGGFVEDLLGEFERSDIVLCPLRIGGGVKVKVSEAIRRANLLVSTTTGGIEGIPAPLRSGVCFADDTESFARHIVRLCADPEERNQLRAQLIANQQAVPTWDDTFRGLNALWSQVASRPLRATARS